MKKNIIIVLVIIILVICTSIFIKILVENDSKIAKRVSALEKWKNDIEGGVFAF